MDATPYERMRHMTNIAHADEIDYAIEVGANIHQMMWRKRISQAALGRAIGVTQGTAGRKIRGEVGITIPELMKIARLLEVEPGDLLKLPELDSNQQPSGSLFSQVRTGVVVDLAAYRRSRTCSCPGVPLHHPSCPSRRSA